MKQRKKRENETEIGRASWRERGDRGGEREGEGVDKKNKKEKRRRER